MTASSVSRRRLARGTLSRQGIVEAALGLLDEEGPEALTFARLGSALDASTTAVYRHFSSRDEIIVALAEELDRMWCADRVSAAREIVRWAIAIAAPADSFGVHREQNALIGFGPGHSSLPGKKPLLRIACLVAAAAHAERAGLRVPVRAAKAALPAVTRRSCGSPCCATGPSAKLAA